MFHVSSVRLSEFPVSVCDPILTSCRLDQNSFGCTICYTNLCSFGREQESWLCWCILGQNSEASEETEGLGEAEIPDFVRHELWDNNMVRAQASITSLTHTASGLGVPVALCSTKTQNTFCVSTEIIHSSYITQSKGNILRYIIKACQYIGNKGIQN